MTFISYAQNGEDVLLWRALGHVERGYYIDVGAHHPDTDSVTRAFYDRGWHGLNVEPLSDQAARLRASRPRDVTLRLALGARSGEAVLHVVDGTGLSTLDGAVAASHAGRYPVRDETVPMLTLAELCRLHAPDEIHFLKIDVEGAELAVLQGADFEAFRPWIVLAEATAPGSTRQTHADWEPLLLSAGYRFVWFDGLNRYYVAEERAEALSPSFATQPNVFDDYLRAADSVWATGIALAETEAAALRDALGSAQAGLRDQTGRMQQLTEHAEHEIARLRERVAQVEAHGRDRMQDAARDAADQAQALHDARHELQQTHLRLQSTEHALHDARHELQQTHLRLQAEQAAHRLVRGSGFMKLAIRLRRALRRPGRTAPALPSELIAPVTIPDALVSDETPDIAPDLPSGVPVESTIAILPDLPLLPPPPRSLAGGSGALRTVHQFHSGAAVGDAITNAMLLTRSLLRAMGYHSEIYVERPPAALAHLLRPLAQLPRHDGYVLIMRHSMGYDRFDEVLALPAPKVLLYHNITPPALLAAHPYLAAYARLGRAQLGGFRGRVAAALADSEYNAIALRRLGLDPVRACTLLFDVEALRARAAAASEAATGLRQDGRFTVLFVGRINQSKGQRDLVEAFAAFRAKFGAPSRLVLVGRDDGDRVARALHRRIDELGLAKDVLLTGGVDDATLDAWYGAADLYVSLSRHEGFGVPLIEAMAHGVPVLAWPGGAVPYTLDGAAELLDSIDPEAVAARMIALAEDRSGAFDQRARQAAHLDRFGFDHQRAVLRDALVRAGAAPPDDPGTPTALRDNLRLSVAGHVNGSYSLAAINRDLALSLEAALPGRVRLLPVEGGATLDLSGVPASQADAVSALVHRLPHATGPELVISQHYPVYVPDRRADLSVALLFWEESLLPAATVAVLEAGFDALVAPTAFVRAALLESGLGLPVRVIPPAVDLAGFSALRDTRVPDPGGIHRFLHVSSCFPRKGVDLLLAAWQRAFRDGDPVRLTIKGFPNPHNDVATRLEALRAADPGLAPVTLIDRDLDQDALLSLYANADSMVLPTRGEGYNLPAAEAMSAGLGLIVSDRGGHLDFCAPGGTPLPGVRLLRTCLVPSETHLATPHSLWLAPDPDDLVAALREARSAPASAASPALPDADAIASAYADLACDLLLRPRPGPLRVSWVSSWALRCGVAEYSRQLLDRFGERLQVRVLCDLRTPPDESGADRYWPCWQIGEPRTAGPLATAIAADDPQIVVIQHQPGLLSFAALAALVADPALQGRVLVATLHNTAHLLDLPDEACAATIAALARLDRVLVHTRADLARLADLGLTVNVALLQHGVAPLTDDAAAMSEPRALDPDLPGIHPVIGSYGFFLPGKGLGVLIEAFAILRARWPEARLRLVNAQYDADVSRAEIAACRALADRLGLGGSVSFETEFLAPHQSRDLLSACDVLALPYAASKEASSAALRGALSSGVPVAVTPIALFDEADQAVARFDGPDAAHVAAGLDRLLRDQPRRAALQRAAWDWIAARQWPDVARRLEGMLTGLALTRALGSSPSRQDGSGLA